MKSPDMGGISPERNEQEVTKTRKLLSMLDEVIQTGRAGDLDTFSQVLETLKQKDFTDLNELISAIESELNSRKWIDQDWPKETIENIRETIDLAEDLPDGMSELIKKWQEKK